MSTSARLDRVRQHLLSLPEIDGEIQRESIVIRDEHYAGRRFEMANHFAIWFIEADELKVYARGNGHLVTLNCANLDAEPTTALEPANIDEPVVLPMFPMEAAPIRKAA